MTRLHASDRPGQTPATPAHGRRALFLHTGWRSAGTWIWGRCREQAQVHAFYEPLHERLAWLRPADIAALRPGGWASNHSQTAPYFQEYGPLLRPGVSGVPRYHRRFAFDRFFLDPDEDDPELDSYLNGLLLAVDPERTGVLKFCRSLGRVGWLAKRFPHALHAVLLRDPASQFASAQALLTGQRNRYFTIAPLMVLASNAGHPLVRQANAALGVKPPELHSDDLAYVTETCWRHVRRSSPGERYRQFMAFWAATALSALNSEALLLEAGRLAHDGAYRSDAEARLGSVAGHGLSLAPRAGTGLRETRPLLPPAEMQDVHLAACVLIRACGGELPAARLQTLLGLLAGDTPVPAGHCPVRTRHAGDGVAAVVGPWPARTPPGPGRRILTLTLVLAARALQPVRRLHGQFVRWQNRLPGRSADQIT